MFTIYYVLNKVNRKAYVGQTCKPVLRRWTGHKARAKNPDTYFAKAISKYGPDAFEIRTIDTASTQERADAFEQFYIRLFDTNDPNRGYNLTDGGAGTPGLRIPKTEEAKKKISESLRGEKNWNFGKPKSEEFRKKISDGFSKEDREAVSQRCTGGHHSDAAKAKISTALKGRTKSPMSEEAKEKLSQSKIKAGLKDVPWSAARRMAYEAARA